MPPGRGRRPAVVFVAGSGPTTRDYLPELHAALLAEGVAVLAYDKRGVGASSGSYPGEAPTASAIDTRARDAAAAARFLAARAEIDRGHGALDHIVPPRLSAARLEGVPGAT